MEFVGVLWFRLPEIMGGGMTGFCEHGNELSGFMKA
jgi:hypothetical protein